MMYAFGRKFDSSEELYMMAVMVDRMFGLVEMAGEAGSGKRSASLSLRARAKPADKNASLWNVDLH